MHNNFHDILENLAEKYSLDKEVLFSVNSAVFKELYFKIKNPSNLILYLDKIGKFYSRRKKAEDGLKRFEYLLNNPKKYDNGESTLHNYNTLEFLLNKYKEFDIIKKEHQENVNNR